MAEEMAGTAEEVGVPKRTDRSTAERQDDALEAGAPSRPYGSLSRDEVVEVALRIIDEDGLEGLSMRRLGAALGVNPMRIYRHFASRDELLAAVADKVARQLMEVPHLDLYRPLDLLVAQTLHLRDVLLQHPRLAPIIASRPLVQENSVSSMRGVIILMRIAGVRDERIESVATACSSFALGYTLYEIAQQSGRRALGEENDLADRRAKAETIRAESGDDPDIEMMLAARLRDDWTERQFLFSLHALMEGLIATSFRDDLDPSHVEWAFPWDAPRRPM